MGVDLTYYQRVKTMDRTPNLKTSETQSEKKSSVII